MVDSYRLLDDFCPTWVYHLPQIYVFHILCVTELVIVSVGEDDWVCCGGWFLVGCA